MMQFSRAEYHIDNCYNNHNTLWYYGKMSSRSDITRQYFVRLFGTRLKILSE